MSFSDLRSLRYFVAVADCGSFSEAALELGISQPAVSRQLALLQTSMRSRLLRRDGKRYVLTESGAVLYHHARRIVDEMEMLNDAVSGADKLPGGHLGVGIPVAIGEVVMPSVIGRYRAKYPKVDLRLMQSDSSTLANLVALGKLDMALVYGRPAAAELEMRTLTSLPLGLIAPTGALATKISSSLRSGERLPLQKVLALPLILPTRSSELRKAFDRAASGAKVNPNIMLEVDGVSLAKSLVSAGLGCMVLAHIGVRLEIALGTLQFIPITRPLVPLTLSIAVRRTKHETPAMGAMIEELKHALESYEVVG